MAETDELTLAEAARELGLSRQRLAVLAKEGRLGHQVAGRYWIFTQSEVEAFKPQVKSSKGGRPKPEAGLRARASLA
jgi:excisionase family DNA binding protein